MALFALHHAGNLAYYRALLHADEVVLDVHEHFPKQTFRNRFEILGPNGRQKLVVPTLKTGSRRTMHEVKISYRENWQKDHWKSLEAAYRRSPYFEFYEDRFRPLYTGKTETLLELNLALHTLILELCDLQIEHVLTEEYLLPEKVQDDQRTQLKEYEAKQQSYLQVFSDRHPFVPNLSILDALFNLGPKTRVVLDNQQ